MQYDHDSNEETNKQLFIFVIVSYFTVKIFNTKSSNKDIETYITVFDP